MIRRSLLALFLMSVMTVNVSAESPIVIKFSHVVAKDTPKGKAAEKFKELAEAATKGRVKIEVYANSTLYKDKEELEALQLGAVHMLAPSMAKFGPLGVKEFELFDLPYLFTDQQSLERVTNGPVGREMLKRLETKGLIGLSFWDNGFKIMSSNRPMHAPTDLKGLKLRIQASKVLDEQMRVLGANPQVMAFSEVYQALQTGVVDGLENVPSNLYTQKMHEVQKHMTVTNHGYIGYAVVVNKKFWEKLPPDVRSQLDGAMKEATEYANKIAQQENEAALDAIRKSGKTNVYTPTEAEKTEWRKVMLPVHKTMEERIGKDLIAAASKAAAGK